MQDAVVGLAHGRIDEAEDARRAVARRTGGCLDGDRHGIDATQHARADGDGLSLHRVLVAYVRERLPAIFV